MAEVPELLPWHESSWENIANSLDRLPHANLLAGLRGSGKFQFASRLCMALLCDSKEDKPCGNCRGCHLYAAGSHPDLHVITSEAMLQSIDPTMQEYSNRYLEDESARSKRKSTRTTILISQIRDLIEQANTASHISKNKVFLIAPIDAMTDSASNSLLKILEEPAPNNYFFLITENVQNVLPTISSRCQVIPVNAPDRAQSERWLAEQGMKSQEIDSILASNMNPILGLRLHKDQLLSNSAELKERLIDLIDSNRSDDALALVDLAVAVGEGECLMMLQQLTADLIKSNLLKNPEGDNRNVTLDSVSKSMDPRKLLGLYDYIGKIRQEIRDGSLDRTLALEDVLLAFGSVGRFRSTVT